MKIKKVSIAFMALAMAANAYADVKVTVQNGAGKTYKVEQTPLTAIDDYAPKPQDITADSTGSFSFKQEIIPVVINISEDTDPIATRIFSAAAVENINVNADGQGDYTATGTPLMEGVTKVNLLLAPFMQKFQTLTEYYNDNPQDALAQTDSLLVDINTALTGYLKDNPDSPEAPYALMMLDGEDFINAYPLLTEVSRQSILMPSVEQKKADEEAKLAQERLMKELESGTVDAPAFTLPDLAGKQVSLSDFKGKWVIIDFWGSWCRWCIKGFPELKELQKKYGDELVILGVDCRDSQERWREAVKKYDMTWVNVYNDCTDENNPLLAAYYVQGFPTKVIVNPEGKIKKIVVGADPAFPEILAGFIGR
ncbi:MAG: TlpA family protein disulfide reductase [Prevotella sp.]|nr:TlpA family protein disulfide reductase [Prevotella sp.]MCM1074112.1 TlpA family protein disulfide reductase [Ruminococcus sp.]